jgi:hypothetical protein
MWRPDSQASAKYTIRLEPNNPYNTETKLPFFSFLHVSVWLASSRVYVLYQDVSRVAVSCLRFDAQYYGKPLPTSWHVPNTMYLRDISHFGSRNSLREQRPSGLLCYVWWVLNSMVPVNRAYTNGWQKCSRPVMEGKNSNRCGIAEHRKTST